MFNFASLATLLPPKLVATVEDAFAVLQDLVVTGINSSSGPVTAANFGQFQLAAQTALRTLFTELREVEALLANAVSKSDEELSGRQHSLDELDLAAQRLALAVASKQYPLIDIPLTPDGTEQSGYGSNTKAALGPAGVTCTVGAQLTHTQLAGLPLATVEVIERLGLPILASATGQPTGMLLGHPWVERIAAPCPIRANAAWLPDDYTEGAAVQLLLSFELPVLVTALTIKPCAPLPISVLEVAVIDSDDNATVCWTPDDTTIERSGTLTLPLIALGGVAGVNGTRFRITLSQTHYELTTLPNNPAAMLDTQYWTTVGTDINLATVTDSTFWLQPEEPDGAMAKWTGLAASLVEANPQLDHLLDSITSQVRRVATLLATLASPPPATDSSTPTYLYTYGIELLDASCTAYNEAGYWLSKPIEIDGELRQAKLVLDTDDITTVHEDTEDAYVTAHLALSDSVDGPSLTLYPDDWTVLNPHRPTPLHTGTLTSLATKPESNPSTLAYVTDGLLYTLQPGQAPVLINPPDDAVGTLVAADVDASGNIAGRWAAAGNVYVYYHKETAEPPEWVSVGNFIDLTPAGTSGLIHLRENETGIYIDLVQTSLEEGQQNTDAKRLPYLSVNNGTDWTANAIESFGFSITSMDYVDYGTYQIPVVAGTNYARIGTLSVYEGSGGSVNTQIDGITSIDVINDRDIILAGTSTGAIYGVEREDVESLGLQETTAMPTGWLSIQQGAGVQLPDGSFALADTQRHRINLVSEEGGWLKWFGAAINADGVTTTGLYNSYDPLSPVQVETGAGFNSPTSIVCSTSPSPSFADRVIIADRDNHRICYYDAQWNFQGWIGMDETGVKGWHAPVIIPSRNADTTLQDTLGSFNSPLAVASSSVNCWVLDTGVTNFSRLTLIVNDALDNQYIFGTVWPTLPEHNLYALNPSDMTYSPASSYLYVTDTGHHRLLVMTASFVFVGWLGQMPDEGSWNKNNQNVHWHVAESHDTEAECAIESTDPGGFTSPTKVQVLGDYILVWDANDRVQAFYWLSGDLVPLLDSEDTPITATWTQPIVVPGDNITTAFDESMKVYNGHPVYIRWNPTQISNEHGSSVTSLAGYATVDGCNGLACLADGTLVEITKDENGWSTHDLRYLGQGAVMAAVSPTTKEKFVATGDGHLYRETTNGWTWLNYPDGTEELPLQLKEEVFTRTDGTGKLALLEYPFIDWDALHAYHAATYPLSVYSPNDPLLPMLQPMAITITLPDGTELLPDSSGDRLRKHGQPYFYTLSATINQYTDAASLTAFLNALAPMKTIPYTLADNSLQDKGLSQMGLLFPELALALQQRNSTTIGSTSARRVFQSRVTNWVGDPSYRVGLLLNDADGALRLYTPNGALYRLVTEDDAFPSSRVLPQTGTLIFDSPIPKEVHVIEPSGDRNITVSDADLQVVLFDFYAPRQVTRKVSPTGVVSYVPTETTTMVGTSNCTDYIGGRSPDITKTPFNNTASPTDPLYFPVIGYTQQGKTLQLNHAFAPGEAVISVKYWTMALHPRLLLELHRSPARPELESYGFTRTPSVSAVGLQIGRILA